MCIQLTSMLYYEFKQDIEKTFTQLPLESEVQSEVKTKIIEDIENIFKDYKEQVKGLSEEKAHIVAGTEYMCDRITTFYFYEFSVEVDKIFEFPLEIEEKNAAKTKVIQKSEKIFKDFKEQVKGLSEEKALIAAGAEYMYNMRDELDYL